MTNAQQVTQTVAKKRRFEISVASRQTFMRFARIKGEGVSSNGRVGVDRFYLDQWESRTRVALIRRFHAWTRRIVAVGNQLSREFKYLLESGERAERSSRWNAEMDFSLERRIRVIAKNRWKEKKATAARATREREREDGIPRRNWLRYGVPLPTLKLFLYRLRGSPCLAAKLWYENSSMNALPTRLFHRE